MALVPDQKFSTFQNGVDLEVGDIIVGLRDGLNTRFVYTGDLPSGAVVPIANGGTGATTASGARTNLGLGTMATQDANAVAITGGTASFASGEVAAVPTDPTDITNKAYVDALVAGFTFLAPVDVATTGALTVTYANGASGVGATLTNAGAQAALTIDGVAVSVNNRVLVKDQASTLQNGIYTVTDIGSGATNWVLTRATDFDTPAEIQPGDLVTVLSGTANGLTLWLQTATVTTIGTDPIVFSAFGAAFSNVVTLTGIQTITGAKNFSAPIVLDNNATLTLNATTAIDEILDEDDMVSDSNTAVPTQQSVKAYVDASPGRLSSFQILTSGAGATYTTPAGVTSILVEVIGGGGGGGGIAGAAVSASGAGGGGSGGYARLWIPTAAASYTYTVGALGAGGAAGNNNGSSGGTTTFGASLQATGGGGGQGSPAVSSGSISFVAGGTVGIGSNGDINAGGEPGAFGGTVTGNVISGQGGSSIYGGGARATSPTVASAYGSGGCGATGAAVSTAGSNGSAGLIVVWEFS